MNNENDKEKFKQKESCETNRKTCDDYFTPIKLLHNHFNNFPYPNAHVSWRNILIVTGKLYKTYFNAI